MSMMMSLLGVSCFICFAAAVVVIKNKNKIKEIALSEISTCLFQYF